VVVQGKDHMFEGGGGKEKQGTVGPERRGSIEVDLENS